MPANCAPATLTLRRLALGGAITALVLSLGAGLPHFGEPGTAQAATPQQARPQVRRIVRPNRRSLEYRLSWGLASINADRAYARGIDGSGVTVALIDTGVSGVPADLFGRLSGASTDLIASRQHGALRADHGEQTAGLLAGALDGEGTVGVAFGATLLSIRADIDGSCEQECMVHGRDLARGIDYALAHGARVIGVPLVGPRRLPSIEAALQRAVDAGAVIVAAAGNDGAATPSWPARYAADPRFAQSIIVAGASTIRGELAAWSSKAAGAAPRYIAAPGQDILVDCGRRYCSLASGTSYSVAYVAGGLSLIMAAHPDLGAPEAARILLAGASRRVRGSDPVSGAGMLDVSRALRIAGAEARQQKGV